MIRSGIDIAADHPAYAGHFPSFPVLPGAVLLDAVFDAIREASAIDITAWQVSSAKFLAAVRPGDVLTLEHEISANRTIRFTVHANGGAVARGTLSMLGQESAA